MTHHLNKLHALLARWPYDLTALLARFSLAATFWKSGQTKIEGFAVDLIAGDVQLGWPRLAESALSLFESEYRLPFLPPELAAPMAALGEHVFPLLILLGLAEYGVIAVSKEMKLLALTIAGVVCIASSNGAASADTSITASPQGWRSAPYCCATSCVALASASSGRPVAQAALVAFNR